MHVQESVLILDNQFTSEYFYYVNIVAMTKFENHWYKVMIRDMADVNRLI